MGVGVDGIKYNSYRRGEVFTNAPRLVARKGEFEYM